MIQASTKPYSILKLKIKLINSRLLQLRWQSLPLTATQKDLDNLSGRLRQLIGKIGDLKKQCTVSEIVRIASHRNDAGPLISEFLSALLKKEEKI